MCAVFAGGDPLPHIAGQDAFAATYAPWGAHAWSASYGGPNVDNARAVATDGAGCRYLAGEVFATIDLGTGPLTGTTGAKSFVGKLGP